MRLENVLAVTGGRLLNAPSISRFGTIALKLKKVTRGTLFIARSPEEIPAAIAKGAYGVIIDQTVIPKDKEIAWIRVDDITSTLPKLLRLWLMVNPRKFLFVPKQVMEFLYHISFDPSLLLLKGHSEQMSAQIFASGKNQTILCSNARFLEHIGLDIETIEPEPVSAKIVSHTLFETSIIINERYYERLPLVPCMMEYLRKAIGVLQKLETPFTLSHLGYTPSFEPFFVNKRGKRLDFGESDRVVIFADSDLTCSCFKGFEKVRWTACSLIIPTHIKFTCDIKLPKNLYGSVDQLAQLMHTELKRPGYRILIGTESSHFFNIMERLGVIDDYHATKGLF